MPFLHHHTGDILEGRGYSGESFYTQITPQEAEHLRTLYAKSMDLLKDLKNRYRGEEAHIFGTGPSLNDYAAHIDWRNKLTIGVNGAPFVIKNLTYWLMVDDFINPVRTSDIYTEINKWVRTPNTTTKLVRKGIVKHPAEWTPDIMFHLAPGPASEIHMGLTSANSSVHAAMDLARHMGVKRMYLWGVDYQDATQHAYNISDTSPKAKDFQKIQSQFKVIGDACKGIEIMNCNPNSRLECFPRVDPEKAVPMESRNYIIVDIQNSTVEYVNADSHYVLGFDQLKNKDSQKSIRKLETLLQAEFKTNG